MNQVAFARSRIFPSCRKFLRRSWLDNSCHTWWNPIYFPSFNQATEVITPQRLYWFACCPTYIHQSTTGKSQFWLCWTLLLRSTLWTITSSSRDCKHPMESTVEHWTGWSHSSVVELSLFKSAAFAQSGASSAPGCRRDQCLDHFYTCSSQQMYLKSREELGPGFSNMRMTHRRIGIARLQKRCMLSLSSKTPSLKSKIWCHRTA